jgi:hypothetical protein
VILSSQSDTGHPLIDEPSILPGDDMIGVINPARKSELVNRSASTFEQGQNAAAAIRGAQTEPAGRSSAG